MNVCKFALHQRRFGVRAVPAGSGGSDYRGRTLTLLYGESILGPSIRCGHDGGGLELDGA